MSGPPRIQVVSVRKIRPSKKNARTHSKKQIRQLANSIEKRGWTAPIVIDENGMIIAGHGRYYAALLLGLKEVPVLVVSGLSDAEKRALALADNQIAANAGWDRKRLAAELGEIATLLPDCDLTMELGFEPAAIDVLLGDFVDSESEPADEIPNVQADPISRRGDVWILCAHRILCGDASSAADIAQLMARQRAVMVMTDVPYNLKIKTIVGRGKTKHREFLQASGELSREKFIQFLKTALSLAAKHSESGSIHFVFMDWRHAGELLAAGEAVYSELKNLIVWVKSHPPAPASSVPDIGVPPSGRPVGRPGCREQTASGSCGVSRTDGATRGRPKPAGRRDQARHRAGPRVERANATGGGCCRRVCLEWKDLSEPHQGRLRHHWHTLEWTEVLRPA
jgi:hypothetical protein